MVLKANRPGDAKKHANSLAEHIWTPMNQDDMGYRVAHLCDRQLKKWHCSWYKL